MTSSKGQAVLTKGRSLSTSTMNGASIGATTTLQQTTSKSVSLREQVEHQRHEPVINLTSLGHRSMPLRHIR
ncbi:hypothetical protein ACFX19_017359 [Malus domestica]